MLGIEGGMDTETIRESGFSETAGFEEGMTADNDSEPSQLNGSNDSSPLQLNGSNDSSPTCEKEVSCENVEEDALERSLSPCPPLKSITPQQKTAPQASCSK